MRKVLASAALAATLVLSACGGGSESSFEDDTPVSAPAPTTYEPSYYGNDDTEQCYFFESPAEVDLLKEDGLCEQDWTPAPWPEDDLAGFYPFFFFGGLDTDRHHYRDRYVPKQRHSAYAARSAALKSNTAFQSKVTTLAPQAKYKASDGSIVSGRTVKTTQFGSNAGGRVSGGSGARQCVSLGATVDLSPAKINLVSNEIVLARPGGGGGGGGRISGGGGGSAPKVSTGGGSAPNAPSGGAGGNRTNPKNNTPKQQAPVRKC